MQAETETVVNNYLRTSNKFAIDQTEWNNTTEELNEIKANQNAEANRQVGMATNSLKKEYEASTKVREAEYIAKEAENKAQINSLNTQLTALKIELESWKKALNDERTASIERAKASSVGSINLTTAGK